MTNNKYRAVVGILMLVAGFVFLLQNLGYLVLGEWMWGILFTLGGLTFLYVLIQNLDENWWAAIPGMALLSIGTLIIVSSLPVTRRLADVVGGSIVLGGIGLSFWIIYFLRRSERWWAIIPGGVLLTLAVVAALSEVSGLETGGVFFLGLAGTFSLVALLTRGQAESAAWAWIPAGILGFMGAALILASGKMLNIALPLLLVGAGIVLVVRSFTRQP